VEESSPLFCPYCGGTRLLESDVSEVPFGQQSWIIYQWNCEDCGEYFNKVVIVMAEGEARSLQEFWG
jgi:C4-type Zn-finger protein